jgi:hypothetical protein
MKITLFCSSHFHIWQEITCHLYFVLVIKMKSWPFIIYHWREKYNKIPFSHSLVWLGTTSKYGVVLYSALIWIAQYCRFKSNHEKAYEQVIGLS